MPIHVETLYEAALIVAKQEDSKANIKFSLSAGLTNVATACAGSMAFGPVGMLVGAAVGSGCFFLMTRRRYKSLYDIINNNLTREEREDFERLLVEAFKDFSLAEGLEWCCFALDVVHNKAAYSIIKKQLCKLALDYYSSDINSSKESQAQYQ